MISVIVPTRSRQEQFTRMQSSIERTVSSPITLIAGSNDPEDKYVDQKFPINCPTVFMWNKMAERAMQKSEIKLFMLGADDIVFETQGWDEKLIEHYNNLENKIHVYHLQDSRDPNGTPHPIVTREYISAMGYFMPPIFLHFFVDTWTVAIAKFNNIFTHFRDYRLVHDKPNDNGNADETHKRIRTFNWLGRDMEVDKTCRHFLDFEKGRLFGKIV